MRMIFYHVSLIKMAKKGKFPFRLLFKQWVTRLLIENKNIHIVIQPKDV